MIFCDLKPGESARICGFKGDDRAYRQKLLAMGLTKGTQITVIRKAPLGDPINILVRGSSLALRKHEAAMIQLERIIECT